MRPGSHNNRGGLHTSHRVFHCACPGTGATSAARVHIVHENSGQSGHLKGTTYIMEACGGVIGRGGRGAAGSTWLWTTMGGGIATRACSIACIECEHDGCYLCGKVAYTSLDAQFMLSLTRFIPSISFSLDRIICSN